MFYVTAISNQISGNPESLVVPLIFQGNLLFENNLYFGSKFAKKL